VQSRIKKLGTLTKELGEGKKQRGTKSKAKRRRIHKRGTKGLCSIAYCGAFAEKKGKHKPVDRAFVEGRRQEGLKRERTIRGTLVQYPGTQEEQKPTSVCTGEREMRGR